MACAQTGSGKTAAFLLPVLSMVYRNGPPQLPPDVRLPPGLLILGSTKTPCFTLYHSQWLISLISPSPPPPPPLSLSPPLIPHTHTPAARIQSSQAVSHLPHSGPHQRTGLSDLFRGPEVLVPLSCASLRGVRRSGHRSSAQGPGEGLPAAGSYSREVGGRAGERQGRSGHLPVSGQVSERAMGG